MSKLEVIHEINSFLEGNGELKYLVNVEVDSNTNSACCVIHEPNKEKKIINYQYTPFLFIKDLQFYEKVLYNGDKQLEEAKKKTHQIKITKLETGGQKRLKEGYCYKVESTRSYNDIIKYFRDGGLNPNEKKYDPRTEKLMKNSKGDPIYLNKDFFYVPRLLDQFFISTKTRLYVGIDEYSGVHKVIFDIETTGLRPTNHRVFAIGVKDNRNFETILESKTDDDEGELNLIKSFFKLILELKPAIIAGYNSENFDFEFILRRAEILGLDLNEIQTTLNLKENLKRQENSRVKVGGSVDIYTATKIWGISVIDINHAAKKTAALNSEIKNTKLKYVAKFEDIAKPNRTYINGEDGNIGKYWNNLSYFIISTKNNEYLELPNEFQKTGKLLYTLEKNKNNIDVEAYNKYRENVLNSNIEYLNWIEKNNKENKYDKYVTGREIVRQYLLDDLWETEKVDELYNQSSFLLAKIIPTNYQRICTMGTASIWNLILTAWSYENNLAIPIPDKKLKKSEKFSGGLARTFKTGFTKRLIKIDYGSLYPFIQLSERIFPMVDITNIMEKLLTYTTTTRNVYKKLANSDKLDSEELDLLLLTKQNDIHGKYLKNTISDKQRGGFKIKQLPIKILNNALFGSLGSGTAFNWSDNVCAGRITCVARLHLRHAISWFGKYDCEALLAVTDGINFRVPDYTKFRITVDGNIVEEENENRIEEMWIFNGKTGINALIQKFNDELKVEAEILNKPYSVYVDNDGEFLSCLNLARINYALLYEKRNKKTGEIERKVKLTGNSLKSKTMPEYIEDFIEKGMRLILEGKGVEFVQEYYKYIEDIWYHRIPLKKIANKSKIKSTIEDYRKRGKDKNGRPKAKQAHMDLLILERDINARNIFREKFQEFENEYEMLIENKRLLRKEIDDYKYEELAILVDQYMPAPIELDTVVYYVNTGLKLSDGESKIIKENGVERIASKLITNKELEENPNLTGDYNAYKYFNAFNKKIKIYLEGFQPEVDGKVVKDRILAKIVKKKFIDEFGNKSKKDVLVKSEFFTQELELKSFVLDSMEDVMFLEEKEIEFWNKTGYDPRLVWNDFKVNESNPIRYDIYQKAIDFITDELHKTDKFKDVKVKSVNDRFDKNDFIVIKNGFKYDLGQYNGRYIQVIKEDVKVPKSDLELKLEEEENIENQKLKKLVVENIDGMKILTESDEIDDDDQDEILEYFNKFKEVHKNIPPTTTLTQMLTILPTMKDTLLDFIVETKAKEEEEDDFYDEDD